MAVNGNVKQSNQSKVNIFTKALMGIKAEIKRITWPSKKEIKKALAAVAVFCVIYMVVVGVLDFGFKNLFKFILQIN